jgi:hypothetical protein
MRRLALRMFPPFDGRPEPGVPSVGQPFALAYTFSPNFTFWGAVIALVSSISRIFLGSLLFAVWGVGALTAWSHIHSYFWRAIALPPLILLFLVLFAALMIAISTIVGWISPKNRIASQSS